jgi:hypothetical protein
MVGILIALAALAAVSTSRPAKRRPGSGTATREHDGPKVRGPSVPETGAMDSGSGVGQRDDAEIVLPAVPGRTWVVQLYITTPRIEGSVRFPLKVGKKTYGWNEAPPDGGKVLEAGAELLGKALEEIGPSAEVASSALGAPPGVGAAVVAAASAIVAAIPDTVRRGRVELWSKWREGKKGTSEQRGLVVAQVARWRDANPLVALQQSLLVGYWQWEGAAGQVPPKPSAGHGKNALVDGYELTSPPTARLVDQGNGTVVPVVTLPSTSKVPAGERRYTVVVSASGV